MTCLADLNSVLKQELLHHFQPPDLPYRCQTSHPLQLREPIIYVQKWYLLLVLFLWRTLNSKWNVGTISHCLPLGCSSLMSVSAEKILDYVQKHSCKATQKMCLSAAQPLRQEKHVQADWKYYLSMSQSIHHIGQIDIWLFIYILAFPSNQLALNR